MRRMSIVLFAAGLLAASEASAEDLRFAHWLPATHPFAAGINDWSKAVADASNGALTVTVYPGGQLGAPNDHYDMAMSGIADFTWISMGYSPGKFPVAEMVDIPFIVSGDPLKASRAFNEWYAAYAGDEMPDIKLCFVHLMPSGVFHSKVPVKVPADAAGLKVRPGSAAVSKYITLMGGTPIPLPATEAREAIERGTADAITLGPNSIILYGIDEMVEYHLDAQLYFPAGAVLMNKARYDGLTGDAKAAVDKYCSSDGAVLASTAWHKWEGEGLGILAGKGHTLYKPTEEELGLWKQAAQPIFDDWKANVTAKGRNPDEIYAAFQAAMKAEGL